METPQRVPERPRTNTHSHGEKTISDESLACTIYDEILKKVKGWRWLPGGSIDAFCFVPGSLMKLVNNNTITKTTAKKDGTRGVHCAYGHGELAVMLQEYGINHAPKDLNDFPPKLKEKKSLKEIYDELIKEERVTPHKSKLKGDEPADVTTANPITSEQNNAVREADVNEPDTAQNNAVAIANHDEPVSAQKNAVASAPNTCPCATTGEPSAQGTKKSRGRNQSGQKKKKKTVGNDLNLTQVSNLQIRQLISCAVDLDGKLKEKDSENKEMCAEKDLEIRRLKEECTKVTGELNMAKVSQRRLADENKEKCAEKDLEIQRLKEENGRIEKDFSTFDETKRRLEEDYKVKCNEKDLEIQRLKEEKAIIEAELNAAKELARRLKEEKEIAESKVSEYREMASGLEKDVIEKEKRIRKIEDEKETLERQSNGKDIIIESLTGQIETLKRNDSKQATTISESNAKAEDDDATQFKLPEWEEHSVVL